MRKRLTWTVLLGAAIVITALYTRSALATPASGFAGTTLALGRFDEINVFNHLILPNAGAEGGVVIQHRLGFIPDAEPGRDGGNIWLSLQRTKGQSDVYVQTNVWQPGGTTGWHSHPGHSLIIVTAGTVTAYEANDPACKPTVYTVGMGFVDPGGDHVHLIRNEGRDPASTIAVQLIPAGAERRIDADDPGNCHF